MHLNEIYRILDTLQIYALFTECIETLQIYTFETLINQKHFIINFRFDNKKIKTIDILYNNKTKSALLKNNYRDFFKVKDFKDVVGKIKHDKNIYKLNINETAKLINEIFFQQLEPDFKYMQNIPVYRKKLPVVYFKPESLIKKIISFANSSKSKEYNNKLKKNIKRYFSLFIDNTNDFKNFINNIFQLLNLKKFANQYSDMTESERIELLAVKFYKIFERSNIKKVEKKLKGKVKNEIKNSARQ